MAQAGETVFLVLRAEFLAGKDVLALFVNPLLAAAEPLLADAELSNINLAPADYLYINNSGGWTIDEIRVGSSFADVAPVQARSVPEPATLALVLLALSAMTFARLRQGRLPPALLRYPQKLGKTNPVAMTPARQTRPPTQIDADTPQASAMKPARALPMRGPVR